MKFAFKSIVAAAAFVAVSAASAASTVNVGSDYNGLTITGGTSTLSFSAGLLSALNVGSVGVTQYGDAAVTIARKASGSYSSVSAAAPMTAVSFDGTNIIGAKTSGGATQTSPVKEDISDGGFISVYNLEVDSVAKRVYADIKGGNGIGDLTHYYLWDITTITGSGAVTGSGSVVQTFGGLKMNDTAMAMFNTALGLLPTGSDALASVNTKIDGFGKIDSVINFAAATPTPAVPEPSTYLLMGLGLVGISMVARRRA